MGTLKGIGHQCGLCLVEESRKYFRMRSGMLARSPHGCDTQNKVMYFHGDSEWVEVGEMPLLVALATTQPWPLLDESTEEIM